MPRNELIITVHKKELLTALKQNRKYHGEAFEKAKAGYIKVTTKQIEAYLIRLANGELLERAFIPTPPEDHTADYDVAIEMMAWSTDDKIELDQQQFRQYVTDNWGWREQWMASNTQYMEA